MSFEEAHTGSNGQTGRSLRAAARRAEPNDAENLKLYIFCRTWNFCWIGYLPKYSFLPVQAPLLAGEPDIPVQK
ncbi:hypothetical protein [Paenibacillus sabinae]|uniref:Uncharacterized protein n=1 Tax=Paenibacillus sabinae T27 TaxID=1268072 RepID=X4ZWZ9_9BACL|nr:hypothetical protein [Paenibacillus sabinae]AHV96229.1 hypothetical protein PSAB_06475 [Paenibacillus sabinae T27]